ncbi:hypothetical protein AZ78_3452 [Lysobacter capsici AZ78]|uniref:Uncharacterized protein n=1 Tax=Lysobacter capsici AZ78 TaxID=1444315 RepID=A0A120AHB2_9GAMM|nr:hypothetical protein AZ78_3452 [Lysobacter capsici AZ78]
MRPQRAAHAQQQRNARLERRRNTHPHPLDARSMTASAHPTTRRSVRARQLNAHGKFVSPT